METELAVEYGNCSFSIQLCFKGIYMEMSEEEPDM